MKCVANKQVLGFFYADAANKYAGER